MELIKLLPEYYDENVTMQTLQSILSKETDDNANSRFVIRFVGTLGIPGNMADLKLTIEEIKPAHLAVEYEYIYNTWSDISALTWQQATSYTWEKIRTVRL